MIYKYQYGTVEERQNLMTVHNTLTLIEEQNIFEGNFLIFTDEPDEIQQLKTGLQATQTAVDFLLLMGGM